MARSSSKGQMVIPKPVREALGIRSARGGRDHGRLACR